MSYSEVQLTSCSSKEGRGNPSLTPANDPLLTRNVILSMSSECVMTGFIKVLEPVYLGIDIGASNLFLAFFGILTIL